MSSSNVLIAAVAIKVLIAAAALMAATQAFDVKAPPAAARPGRLIDSSLNYVDDAYANDILSMGSFLAPTAATAEIASSAVPVTTEVPSATPSLVRPKAYDLPAHHNTHPLLAHNTGVRRPRDKILEEAELGAGRLSIFVAVMMLTCEIASGQGVPEMISSSF